MHRTLTLALMVLLSYENAFAEDSANDSKDSTNQLIAAFDKDIDELTDAYKKKVAELDAAYIAKVAALKDSLIEKLAELQKSVAAVDLDEAIRIRDQAREIQNREILPSLGTGGDAGNLDKADAKSRNVAKLRKEIAAKAARIVTLEKRIQTQSQLANKVTGVSYRITFGNKPRLWTFGPNGVLLANGSPTATRWTAFDNAGIVCIGADNGNIDLCQFSDDGSKIEVIYVGNFKESRTHHLGVLAK